MLSILIPTYNYNILPLVSKLYEQAVSNTIDFEILCFDDGSREEFSKENMKINSLDYCSYTVLKKNIGRSAIRNLLANTARYDTLLFLDADTMPVQDHFLSNYIKVIKNKSTVIFGGIIYQKLPPHKDQLLRWVYGTKREALSVEKRSKSPHISLLTLNFIIPKITIQNFPFDESIPNLRHEDTLFALQLKKHSIPVVHIDNPVVHLGLESSKTFLKKSLEAVDILIFFLESKLVHPNDIKLTRIAERTSLLKVHFIINKVYNLSKSLIKKNLLSKRPILLLFDFYRLGYYLKNRE